MRSFHWCCVGALALGLSACAGGVERGDVGVAEGQGSGAVDESVDMSNCGNGVVDEGEICDTAIPVPQEGCCAFLEFCDDGDPCTVDRLVNDGTCLADCDFSEEIASSGNRLDGCCPSGTGMDEDSDCASFDFVPVASGSTIWRADTAPPGGAAGATGGCEVLVLPLTQSIFIELTVRLDVSTDGNDNYKTTWTVTAENALLGPAGAAAEFDSLELNAVVVGGSQSLIFSGENPSAVGTPLQTLLTGNLLTLRTPGQITSGQATIVSGPSGVSIGWDGNFELALTLGGAPLATLDSSVCTFNVQGSPVSFGDSVCSVAGAETLPAGCVDDGNDCTVDTCEGSTGVAVCVNTPRLGSCTDAASISGLGVCQGSVCEPAGCTADGCPDDGNECTAPLTCDSSTERCGPAPPANEPNGTGCDGGEGTCQSGTCVDNCVGVVCDDGDDCTTDPVCDSAAGGVCPDPVLAPSGTVCATGTIAPGLCDGAGGCEEQELPDDRIEAGSGQVVWHAMTSPPGGTIGGTGGCQVEVTALNMTIAIDVMVTLDVTSDGFNNLETAWTVVARNALLGPAGGAAGYASLDLNAVVSGGSVSAIPSSANPSAVGSVLSEFLEGNVLTLNTPGEITEGGANVVPGPTGVSVGWDGNFVISLTLGGNPLATLDGSVCTFDIQGPPVTFGTGTGSDL